MASILSPKTSPSITRILMVGDVMLGRLIDQAFSTHVDDPEDQFHFRSLLSWKSPQKGEEIKRNGHKFVWGNLLPLFCEETDIRIINLETSVTTHPRKWPNKVFNYRMHPDNLECLTVAKIDYCSLANNHTLDFDYEGMRETIQSLKSREIAFAGVGENRDEAIRPAWIEKEGVKMAIFSFTDHPSEWRATASKPGVNLVSFSSEDLVRIQQAITSVRNQNDVDLVILSIHWGSNYAWRPPQHFREFAHRVMDFGADIIHGHSSHHVQGIEIYKGKPILYGCGDFVDDYAVDEDYRNDLGFAYVLQFNKISKKMESLEMVPTQIQLLSVTKDVSDQDSTWLKKIFETLCQPFGTNIQRLSNGNLFIPIAS